MTSLLPPTPGAAVEPPSPAARPAPRNPADLFWSFTWLALQGFGGVMALVQREVVDKKRWLSREEFLEEWAVAQVMPGPNVVNLSIMIGDRYFGLRGAVAAMAGMLLLPLVLVLLAALAYAHWAAHPAVAGALRGMGAVAAGMVGGMGLKLMPALRQHPLGPVLSGLIAVAAFVAVAWWRIPLPWVLLVLGLLAYGLTWRKVAP
ncbi:MAG: chromate transporter [Giesbergeria sp.]|uniref:chromate transporter n=1 Tax=Giesbergeria sp. TaxID=2818473 RepID=UPI0026190C56|nr:chromate transporter [Giesbergeria sp.]MDD2610702.1 chromate transporter [Giesbergeria sp.]